MRLPKIFATATVLSLLVSSPSLADTFAQTTEVVSLSGSMADAEKVRNWLSGASFAFLDNGTFIYDLPPGTRRDWFPLRGQWEYSGRGETISFWGQTTTNYGASSSGVVIRGTFAGNQIRMQTISGVNLSQCSLGYCSTSRNSSNYSSILNVSQSSR